MELWELMRIEIMQSTEKKDVFEVRIVRLGRTPFSVAMGSWQDVMLALAQEIAARASEPPEES